MNKNPKFYHYERYQINKECINTESTKFLIDKISCTGSESNIANCPQALLGCNN